MENDFPSPAEGFTSGDPVMASFAPPPIPPHVALGDDDGNKKLRMRLVQVMATLVTLLATVWLCTLGMVPGIIGVMVAKHVLVAVLVMGLGVDAPQEAGARTSPYFLD
jgi:hypothetical protein